MGLRGLGKEVEGMLRSGSMIVLGVMGIEVIERYLKMSLDEVGSRRVSLVLKHSCWCWWVVRMDVAIRGWKNVMEVIERM